MIEYVLIAVLCIVAIVIIVELLGDIPTIDLPFFRDFNYVPPDKRAGDNGEKIVAAAIRRVMRDGDELFTNVTVSYEDKVTELDNIVVNRRGVFIFEVKNYSGELVGGEDDYEWEKYHTSTGGNTYLKMVKNPIKQVKRQTYILAKYLESYGVPVWVDGYAVLLGSDAPTDSGTILYSAEDIDRVMHKGKNSKLTVKTTEAVCALLSD